MAASSNVKPPYVQFYDIDGQPLEDGYIYIGTAGLDPATNAQTIYSDSDLSTTVTQPVRTVGGFPVVSGSPIRIYTAGGDFSLRVSNKNNTTIHQDLNVADDDFGGSVLLVDYANSIVGIGAAPDLGSGIHVKKSDTGGTVNSNADNIVIEENANAGMSVLTGNTNAGYYAFGDPDNNFMAYINYDHNTDVMGFYTSGSTVMSINAGRVGISAAADLGDGLHIKTADSGASVSADADELVIENSGNSGLAILSGASSSGHIDFGDSGNSSAGRIQYNHSTGAILLYTEGANRYNADGVAFNPATTETYNLGSASLEWNNIYTQNAVTVSDSRKKESIQPIAYGTTLLKALNPVQFAYKDTIVTDDEGNEVIIPHGRPHTGFLAQEVKDAMTSIGLGDWAGYALEDDATMDDGKLHTLRLSEFIGVLVAGFKELEARVTALEA